MLVYMFPVIKCQNITKEFGSGKARARILKGVDLEIYPSEFVILFGPSGCGKSTLLNVIAGLEPPTSGKVFIRGQDITQLSSDEAALYHRTKIGMVFQAYNLIRTLNVWDNVVLPQVFAGISKKRRFERAKSLLREFDLFSRAKLLPSELSGGQQQKIAIARSLVNNPWILLVDEPTGNLDSKSAQEVMAVFKDLNENKKRTILLVTHNPKHLYYANKIFYMKDGIIIKRVERKIEKQIDKRIEEPFRILKTEEDFAKDFFQLSELEIKVKLLTNKLLNFFRLNELAKEEIARLEKIIALRLEGKIDDEKVFQKLDKPFEEGGVGFYKQTARNLVDHIERFCVEEIKNF